MITIIIIITASSSSSSSSSTTTTTNTTTKHNHDNNIHVYCYTYVCIYIYIYTHILYTSVVVVPSVSAVSPFPVSLSWHYARSIMFPAIRFAVLANTPFQQFCFPFQGLR